MRDARPIRRIRLLLGLFVFCLLACVLVIPLALTCGALRGIPWFWRLIDCSFGVFGLIPLALARQMILRMGADHGLAGVDQS